MCGSAEGPTPEQIERRAIWKFIADGCVEVGERYELLPDGSWRLVPSTGYGPFTGYHIVGCAKPTITIKKAYPNSDDAP